MKIRGQSEIHPFSLNYLQHKLNCLVKAFSFCKIKTFSLQIVIV